ncbi:MAG TPA: glycogen debranching N-terminal domain-containing protein [Solirubrobacteraceae bacterium]|nr:glycogen debranching N-terminal domain-containing protein [Solirubrobacteraceae bacterium]
MTRLPPATGGGERVSPNGEAFEIAGEAGPVEFLSPPPVPAEARADLLVIKSGDAFLCARPTGDVLAPAIGGEGFYTSDTRVLSELRLTFGEAEPVLLSHSADAGFQAVVESTNPRLHDTRGMEVPQETISLRRTLLVDESLYLRVALRSYLNRPAQIPLELSLAADYADVFEIRGVRSRPARGRLMVPKLRAHAVAFAYEGEDGLFQETVVRADRPPYARRLEGERVRLRWEIELAPRHTRELCITITPVTDGRRSASRPFARAVEELERGAADWTASCTRVSTDSELHQRVLGASVRDLHALITPAAGTVLPAAGIPWYVAPFGRDALITACEALMLRPTMARETLVALARLQARADEPWRDAEPGKILHELRSGELARAGLIPHTPYYGTVDATPLFLMLASAYWRWTGDAETLSTLRPALDAALDWIDRHGDRDGDGFLEYERRAPAGLENQGWKDSHDSVVHADGRLAEGPIALVEVQAYVYEAKLGVADVYEALGEADRARALRTQAAALRVAFNEAFWNPEEDTFALALDGRKRQVGSVTSNAGHALYCAIADAEKAVRVAGRLMGEDMFSGWGIRTLSAENPAYNPMSYHNGSVWPHDNAIIAAGLKRYGHDDAAARIAAAIFEIAARSRDHRLAELYCGFARGERADAVPYPVACMPQAWAAAAPFMLLQTTLGLSAHAPSRTLAVIRPQIPEGLGRIELRGLRVGAARVALAFARTDGVTGFSLLEQEGDIAVTMAAAVR